MSHGELVYDYAAVAASLFMMFLYQVFNYSKAFCCPGSHTLLGKNFHNAKIWLRKHQEKRDPTSVALAVQTLRNTILVAIFLGGSAFQNGLNSLSTPQHTIPNKMRAIILCSFLFLSFLNWASVIRLSSHLGYMIDTINDNPTQEELDRANENKHLLECERMMRKMLTNFSLGFRFSFFSIPFYFYSGGPTFLVISTFFLLIFLAYIDMIEGFGVHVKGEGMGET